MQPSTFSISTLSTFIGMLSTTIIFVFAMFILRPIRLHSSDSSCSYCCVNSLGEMVSPCLTPILILIFSLSLCRCTVTELSVYMSFGSSMYTSSIPYSCNDVNIAWVCTSQMPSRNPRTQHTVVCCIRGTSLFMFV